MHQAADLVEAEALDELHDVVVHAVLLTDTEFAETIREALKSVKRELLVIERHTPWS